MNPPATAKSDSCFSRVQSIIVSRFLLGLRRAATPPPDDATTLLQASSARFRVPTVASIVEDMGAPIACGREPEDESSGMSGEDWGIELESITSSINVVDEDTKSVSW